MSNGGLITDYLSKQGSAPVSAPSIPSGETALVLDTATNQAYMYDGSAWQNISGGGGGSGAMTQISKQTLGTATASVTFSGISGSYSALLLVYTARGDAAAAFENLRVQCNSDTGANYAYQNMDGNNGTTGFAENASDTSLNVGYVSANTAPSGSASGGQLVFEDYAGTTFHKHVGGRYSLRGGSGAGNMWSGHSDGWWLSTSALTSITLFPQAGNFVTGSTFILYGLS